MRLALLALIAAPLFSQTADSYKLVWSDEFNGPAGSTPDAKNWSYDTGNGKSFGNNEIETYTSSTDNVYLDGSGNLVIKALNSGSSGYTSGRINTQKLFSIAYGKVEGRMKIPRGQGLWPAFWMLGANFSNDANIDGGVPWPQCGEIDIMENIGREPTTVHGTVHGPGYFGANGITHAYSLPNNASFADDYHVYAVIWKPNSVQFLVDDQPYFAVTPVLSLPLGTKWVFDHPFFLILDLAVGGDWPGNPDSSTVFPQTLSVDYVRVYRSTAEPIVEAGGIVDAALFSPQLAPGSLASAFGTGLSDATYSSLFDSAHNAFVQSVSNVAVTVNAKPAPLIYVSERQINFQIPWATPVNQPVDIVVTRNGIVSDTQSITLGATAPAVFTANNAAIVTGSAPAYTMWGTGFGPTASSPSDGVPFPAGQSTSTNNCTLTINTVSANVGYCGTAPGLVINQLNFEYPSGLPVAATYPATLKIDNSTGVFQIPAPPQ